MQRERRKLAERLVDGRRAEEGPESPANTYEVAYSDTKLEVRKKPLILSDGQLEGFFGNKKSLRGIPCKNGYWFEDVHPESGRKRFRRPTQKEMESEDLSFDVRCKCKRCHGRKNWKKFYAARLERE